MKDYLLPYAAAESEFVEKRSRFIGQVWRVHTEEESRQYIEQSRKKHYDARHNCWCYILQEGGVIRYSDDGEPQGTAGQPMLNVFLREGVSDVCCVVTRYFGGILLGTGGLTRAYTKAAKDALCAAGICRMGAWHQGSLHAPYGLVERLKPELTAMGAVLEDTLYAAEVTLLFRLPAGGEEALDRRITELSSGSLAVQWGELLYCPGQREDC